MPGLIPVDPLDIPHGWKMSSRFGLEVLPGGVLVVEASALQAGVEDADPAVGELEQRYGLARGTIRKAIGVLRDEGLIITVRGKGSYVAEAGDEAAGQ